MRGGLSQRAETRPRAQSYSSRAGADSRVAHHVPAPPLSYEVWLGASGLLGGRLINSKPVCHPE
jgi:hypothetical protein